MDVHSRYAKHMSKMRWQASKDKNKINLVGLFVKIIINLYLHNDLECLYEDNELCCPAL